MTEVASLFSSFDVGASNGDSRIVPTTLMVFGASANGTLTVGLDLMVMIVLGGIEPVNEQE